MSAMPTRESLLTEFNLRTVSRSLFIATQENPYCVVKTSVEIGTLLSRIMSKSAVEEIGETG